MIKAEKYVHNILEEKLGKKAARVRQFPTGLSHFVYDVTTYDDFPCVIRIAIPERTDEFKRGLFWHEKIERAGVRLPLIYEIGEIDNHHYAVYERLEGDDLENVYSSLSAQEKRMIAEEVAEIQKRISLLDQAMFQQANPWDEVLRDIIVRSEREILDHGLSDPKYIDLICEHVEEFGNYYRSLKPVSFLYDLNIRNVIVNDGKLTGIIDVDEVWYGDPLLAIGRGKTILLAMRCDLDFIDYWCEYLNLSVYEIKIVDLNALLYCLRFMGTIGTKLNGNASIQTNPENARLFESIADNLLGF